MPLLDAQLMCIIMRILNAYSEVCNMAKVFDSNATKKPTNLSVNSDLLSRARKMKINLSATLERALVLEIRNSERERWLKKNKKAISELNNLAETEGLFSDSFRKL
jgi:antitoxin CcdA